MGRKGVDQSGLRWRARKSQGGKEEGEGRNIENISYTSFYKFRLINIYKGFMQDQLLVKPQIKINYLSYNFYYWSSLFHYIFIHANQIIDETFINIYLKDYEKLIKEKPLNLQPKKVKLKLTKKNVDEIFSKNSLGFLFPINDATN